MADTQYDVPPKVVRLFNEKQKIREAVRQAVLKRETNPHLRYGYPYDSAVTRYHALWGYRNEHVYANTRNMSILFFTFVVPVGILFYDMVRHHNKKEKILRSGQIAYEDRCYKELL